MINLLIKDISEPTLLLDEFKCKNNIKRTLFKIKSLGIDSRPHFKTHQSKLIGNWFGELGVKKITVSSLKMAKYFLQSGWTDILIAFPLNIRELDEILVLSSHINLKITISDINALEFLANVITFPIEIYLEIDVGYNRSGLDINDLNLISKALKIVNKSKFLKLVGIISHNGLNYYTKDKKEVVENHRNFLSKLLDLKNFITHQGNKVLLTIGDTPSISICDDFLGVDELCPGNFVFYDVMQASIGSCSTDDIAICLAVPIVGIYPARNEMVCYGGATHLSKESLRFDSAEIYGLVVDIYENDWSEPLEDTFVKMLTQEHLVIKTTQKVISRHKVGDLVGILPIHSCLTADAMKKYLIPNSGWVDHL